MNWLRRAKVQDALGTLDAISRSQAIIEFDLDGIILTANDNFLKALGYTLAEIAGKHHSMFVIPAMRESAEYREFWAKLGRGDYQAAEYQRVGNGGKEVWIQASYNPILDLNGKPFKIVKYATDVTVQVVARVRGENVRAMLESVAANAQDLIASVSRIATSTAQSSKVAVAAVEQVEMADSQVQRLNVAAQAMGGIVQLIGDITGQINLLALNATIEAGARRRGGPRLRRRRIRGQESCQSGQARDRSHLRRNQRVQRHLQRGRGRPQARQECDRNGRRVRHGYGCGDRGTKRRHRRDVSKHAARRNGSRANRAGGVSTALMSWPGLIRP